MINNSRLGLALSGGGYRAAAYHIGALRALHKLGVLDKVDVISSVSGGSIIAASYALHEGNYESFEKEFSQKMRKGVLHLAFINLTLMLALVGLATWFGGVWGLAASLVVLWFAWYKVLPVSNLIAWQYDRLFFHGKKLKDLKSCPVVTINATDYPTVSQFTFSCERMYDYYYGDGAFYHEQFPVSKAVMASSCVPFIFCPIRIPMTFWTSVMNRKKQPMLLDGGLYDNQGTHVLTDKMSPYKCSYIIVSDAGNGEVSDKWVFNPLVTLKRTSEVFMQRIKKIQIQQNLFMKAHPDKRFAYALLEWDVNERMLKGFVDNLKHDNIDPEVVAAHQITPEDIAQLKNSDTAVAAGVRIIAQLKRNIQWDDYKDLKTSEEEHKKAYAISTGLSGLCKEKIELLSKEAEWKVMMQVRLYLPMLLN
ncbi:patatin-like phospholipase family protein [Bacteroides heparinolyticus]|uniref:patatin-like phospholipase family protein n=1 Tax=Prevotella heparinolytica TaxID=28113 RepID=UPI0035A1711F